MLQHGIRARLGFNPQFALVSFTCKSYPLKSLMASLLTSTSHLLHFNHLFHPLSKMSKPLTNVHFAATSSPSTLHLLSINYLLYPLSKMKIYLCKSYYLRNLMAPPLFNFLCTASITPPQLSYLCTKLDMISIHTLVSKGVLGSMEGRN